MSTQRFETTFRPNFFSSSATAPRELIKNFVLGLDLDGCTSTRFARGKIIDDIAKFVLEHPEVESIDYIISSLRQSFIMDYSNAINNPLDDMGRTQSCTVLSEGFQSQLESKIHALFAENNLQRPVPVIRFHPLLLSDILNDFVDGATLDKMAEFHHYSHYPDSDSDTPFVTVQNRSGLEVSVAYFDEYTFCFESATESGADNPANDFYDTSKILLIWVQMQYFAHVFGKDKSFVFRFVDDNLDIIGGVTQFFRKNSYLMPENSSLECMYMSCNYNHYPPEYKPGKSIKGRGPLHASYRDIALQTACNVSTCYAEADEAGKTLLIKELLRAWNVSDEEYSSDDEPEVLVAEEPADAVTRCEEIRLSTAPQLPLFRPVARSANLQFFMERLLQDDNEGYVDSLAASIIVPAVTENGMESSNISLTGSRTTP